MLPTSVTGSRWILSHCDYEPLRIEKYPYYLLSPNRTHSYSYIGARTYRYAKR